MRREVFVHPTRFVYDGHEDLSAPGAIQEVYRALVEDEERNTAIVADVSAALRRGRHCLVLTNRRAHLDLLACRLRADGHAPLLLHGGLSAKARRQAIANLATGDGQALAVATGPFIGEGFDCPPLDTVFLVFPMKFKGKVVQYVGRVLRRHDGKDTVEVHDYVDEAVPILAYTRREREAGYASLGFERPLRAQSSR
jgi:superfamily II DNA or RNA helicase